MSPPMDQEVMTRPSIITFSNVGFSFSKDQPLFKSLSFELEQGAFHLIAGPSGSGKSTLLRLINRLEEPLDGEILFKGRPLSSFPPAALRRSILYIQQIPAVIEGTVRENLVLPFTFKNNQDLTRPDDGRLKALLNDFLLTGVSLDDNARTLSVGQLQRLCFIRGLLLTPEILLLDEPASALDKESALTVDSVTQKLNLESGLTVLLVSHRSFKPQGVKPVILEVSNSRVKERQ